MGSFLLIGFIAGAFVASPELRAYAANTVFSTDIVDGEVKTADLANNAVTAAKVKDGEIKAAEIATNAVGSSEIATDAVGAAELQGVTKLLYGQCILTASEGSTVIGAGSFITIGCSINGVDSDDTAMATFNDGSVCFSVEQVQPTTNEVKVILINECATNEPPGAGRLAVIVFDK